MKKLFPLLVLVLCLSALSGCGEREGILETPPVATGTPPAAETPVPTEVPTPAANPDPLSCFFDRAFTRTDFCGGLCKTTHSAFSNPIELSDGRWLFQLRQWEVDDPEKATLLRVYDPDTNEYPAQLELPGWPDVDVNGDRIIIREDRDLYWLSPDLSFTSEWITLPDFLFEDVFIDGVNCGRPIYNYTVSYDLTKLVYCCRVRGIVLYDLETGESKALLPPKKPPFYYDEDFDWWMTPHWFNFLPGDREVAFVTDNNIFYVANVEDGSVWSQKAGTLADVWGIFWHKHSPEPFPCLTEIKGGYLIQYVDLNQKTVSEGREYLHYFDGLVYNHAYFAYLDDGIVVCDLETLTPRTVLRTTSDPGAGMLELDGVTEDGRVLFHFYSGIDGTYLHGVTDPLP